MLNVFTKSGRKYERVESSDLKVVAQDIGEPFVIFSDHDSRLSGVHGSPGNWILGRNMTRDYKAADYFGETRLVKWGQWNPAFNFSSWRAYDEYARLQELERLQLEVKELRTSNGSIRDILRRVSKINNVGGPDSRKAVRELINSLI